MVEIVVAVASFAFTAAVISALQSTLVEVVVPVVVTEELLDELVVDVLLVLELTLVTLLPDPSRIHPRLDRAGIKPARYDDR
ncbi:hypothetical protein [Bradyrhizobium sp. CCGB01]|uniref:hypothetical protein n=1 Tax=Bradyrhizobium sp. CCGB01 TaxID=2949634 RepID=UPI0020B4236D|nr:hypothetical protein [Bradyrhizobium sp. CCGB01]MCP3411050.1 hypothetical protein [Bradyrhizobium sp. CCGB01]